MKLSLRLPLLSGLLAFGGTILAAAAPTVTPYLETTPITILWNFQITGVSNPAIPASKAAPSLDGVLDPSQLLPAPRVTTEVGAPFVYPKGNGTQAFFIKHLLRMLVENGTIDKKQLADNWELTAVRNAQYSVDGLATTPYAIYLTRIDRLVKFGPMTSYLSPVETAPIYDTSIVTPVVDPDTGDITSELSTGPQIDSINTGLVLTLGKYVGNYSETYSNGKISKASGSVTCAFTLSFASAFYEDPKYLLTTAAQTLAQPGVDYNVSRNIWGMRATGYTTFNVVTKPGVQPSLYAQTTKFNGVGSWYHAYDNLNPDSTQLPFLYGGVAPVSIHMQTPRYQSRYLFPDFTP